LGKKKKERKKDRKEKKKIPDCQRSGLVIKENIFSYNSESVFGS